jgi:selenocysteine-specific elongation factor
MKRAKIGGPDALAVGEAILRRVEAAKKIVAVDGSVKIPGHVARLDASTSDLKPAIEEAYRAAALSPPTIKEITEKHAARAKEVAAVIGLLQREGVLVKVSQDLSFHKDAMAALQSKLVEYLTANAKITALQFKELAGNITRKFMIPLLEHFDAAKLTMRVGDERVLRKRT